MTIGIYRISDSQDLAFGLSMLQCEPILPRLKPKPLFQSVFVGQDLGWLGHEASEEAMTDAVQQHLQQQRRGLDLL